MVNRTALRSVSALLGVGLLAVSAGFLFSDFFGAQGDVLAGASQNIQWSDQAGLGVSVPACSSASNNAPTCSGGAAQATVSWTYGGQHGSCNFAVFQLDATAPITGLACDSSRALSGLASNTTYNYTVSWNTSIPQSHLECGNFDGESGTCISFITVADPPLTGINDSMSGSFTTPSCAISPVPTASLSAAPNPVPFNTASTLTWSSTNATSCTGSGGTFGGAKATGGNQSTGNLTANTTYTLTCTGPGGTSPVQTVTVGVGAAPAVPTVGLTAVPNPIPYNTASTLTWSSTNATSCTGSGGTFGGAKPTSGNQSTGNLVGNTAYGITCTGPGGTNSDNITVNVNAPTLGVALSSNPISGQAPLTSSLTASVNGSATGPIDYRFDCTNDGSYEVTVLGSALTTYTATNACTYSTPGNYTARVRADRAGQVSMDSVGITVSTAGAPTLGVTLTPTPSSGNAPLAANLNATVNGSATGNIRYRFDCTDDGIFEQDVITGANPGTFTCNYPVIGFYVARVIVDREGVSANDAANITVSNLPPVLAVNPASLAFSATEGGASPANQLFNVTNTGGGTMNWTIVDDQPWLSVNPISGSNNAPVTVSVNSAGLPANTYTGTITVTAPGVSGSPKTISVTLTVNPVAGPSCGNGVIDAGEQCDGANLNGQSCVSLGFAAGSLSCNAGTCTFNTSACTMPSPILAANPGAVNFTGTYAGANPAPQSITVQNTGGGTMNWSASGNQTWMLLNPTFGTNNGSITVNIDTAGLLPGSYSGLVTVNAPGAAGSPDSVAVNLSVSEAPPLIVTFKSSPVGITQGQASRLDWDVNNCTSPTCSCSASAAAPTSQWNSATAISLPVGFKPISPVATTYYTLICSNTAGSVSRTTAVNVGLIEETGP